MSGSNRGRRRRRGQETRGAASPRQRAAEPARAQPPAGSADPARRGPARWIALGVALAVVAGVVAWQASGPGDGAMVRVKVPDELSPAAAAGRVAFERTCAACHGATAGGSDRGPPLVHDIYNPGHHADAAFYRAVEAGVRPHHWRFGAMPPQPGVSRDEVRSIIRYVRELQRANGIEYRRHRM